MSEVALAAAPRPGNARDVIGWSAVGVGAVGTVAVVGQRVFDAGPAACAARTLFGIPCPVCGLSTSVVGLAHAEVVDAVGADALGVGFVLIVAVLAAAQLARAVGLSRWQPDPRASGLLAVGVLVGHWLATLTGVVTLSPPV